MVFILYHLEHRHMVHGTGHLLIIPTFHPGQYFRSYGRKLILAILNYVTPVALAAQNLTCSHGRVIKTCSHPWGLRQSLPLLFPDQALLLPSHCILLSPLPWNSTEPPCLGWCLLSCEWEQRLTGIVSIDRCYEDNIMNSNYREAFLLPQQSNDYLRPERGCHPPYSLTSSSRATDYP